MEDSIQNESVKEKVGQAIQNSPLNCIQEALRAILICLGLQSESVESSNKKEEKRTDDDDEDEQQKGEEPSSQELPDSTMVQPVDPPISTIDDPPSSTDQEIGDFAIEATLARRPPRPGVSTSPPQTNDLPT